MNTDKGGLLEEETSERVIRAFYSVYSELGFGFLESVYENAMAIALRQQRVPVLQQAAIEVMFRGQAVGEYRADLLIPKRMIVEVKAVSSLAGVHEAQLLNYLKATGIRIGLLLNFGPKPQIKRRIH